MPTETEINFFITAFKLLDEQEGTNRFPQYLQLVRESENGRIDWGKISNFLSHRNKGYFAAILKTVDLVIKIWRERKSDQSVGNICHQLTLLSHEIHESRKRRQNTVQREQGFINYYIIYKLNLKSLQTGETVNHKGACQVWKEAWEKLRDTEDDLQSNTCHIM